MTRDKRTQGAAVTAPDTQRTWSVISDDGLATVQAGLFVETHRGTETTIVMASARGDGVEPVTHTWQYQGDEHLVRMARSIANKAAKGSTRRDAYYTRHAHWYMADASASEREAIEHAKDANYAWLKAVVMVLAWALCDDAEDERAALAEALRRQEGGR